MMTELQPWGYLRAGGIAFQAEGTAGAKALRWEQARCVQGPGKPVRFKEE